jgi:hypothetical protein
LKTSADALIWTVDNISNALNLSQLLASSGSAANPPYTFAADPDTGMYLAAVGQIGLTANGKPVLRSTDTTMIIGQSGGSNDVDITHYGDMAQTGNVTQTGNVVQTGNWTLTGDVNVTGAAVFNEAGADKDFRVEGDTNPNLLFVDASTDRVGLGTNAPAHTLDVDVASASFRVRNATGGNDFTVKSVAGPITQIGSVANTPLQILTNDVARVHVTAAGNVGIGVVAPNDKLDVDGVIRISSGNVIRWVDGGNIRSSILGDASSNLIFSTASTERARISGAGLFQYNNGYGSVATVYGCRAWINFDGTAVVSPASMTGVRGSGNVSSVLDNGTGDYTINFTTAMPDANYSVVCSAGNTDAAGEEFVAFTPSASVVAGSVKIRVSSGSGAATDVAVVSAAIFR